jgi:hypothetical protein
MERDIEAGTEDSDTGEAGVERESDMEEVDGETDRDEGSNEVFGCAGVVGYGESCDENVAS